MSLTIELSRTVPDDIAATAVGVAQGDTEADLPWDHLRAQGFEAKKGEVRALPTADGGTQLVVGLGPVSEIDAAVLRHAAGALARAACHHPSLAVDLLGPAGDAVSAAAGARAVAEGLILGGYRYCDQKSDPEPVELSRAVVIAGGGKRTEAALEGGRVVAQATNWARDLLNEPGGSLTPTKLARLAVAEAKRAGFDVTVWDQKEIRAERLGGLLGVNRGSEQAPRFLRLEYAPPSARATVALVGKGITFDSGGLSLKPTEGMLTMKGDMGGAAAVLGAFSALSRLGAKVRVLGFLPLTDNMTGGDATRVGDVLTIRNGKTVEVLNTDAEGRLVLADALSLASEEEPDAILDVATLTGACMVGLGDRIGGLMGNHQGWVDQVQEAADTVDEPVWQLPLPGYLRKKLDSDVADLRNVTDTRYGGALSAGLFLREFVGEGIPWAHLDIAGPAKASEVDGHIVKGGTGFGVRTLVELLSRYRKPRNRQV